MSLFFSNMLLGQISTEVPKGKGRDIAAGIKSNSSRVSKALKDLISLGEVEVIKHDGCVTEYGLTPQGLQALKATTVFAELKP